MNPTTFAAYFNHLPSRRPKAERPHPRGRIQRQQESDQQGQDKQAAAMSELLDEVVRRFQL